MRDSGNCVVRLRVVRCLRGFGDSVFGAQCSWAVHTNKGTVFITGKPYQAVSLRGRLGQEGVEARSAEAGGVLLEVGQQVVRFGRQ